MTSPVTNPDLPVPPTMASPSWWGADSERHRRPDGTFVKVLRPAALTWIDTTTASAAATAAGEAGLGPRVLAADPASGTLVLADHTADAKTATLDDLADDGFRASHLAARDAVADLVVPGARRATVFDDVRAVHELARATGTTLPRDLDWMLRVLADAEARIGATGYDPTFCHGDGNVSNVLRGRDGGHLLLDWDVAAVMDPMQDIGVVLAELADTEAQARALFEQAWGTFTRAGYARARVYGAADQVRWGLVGAYVDRLDPGTHEYSKFSDWQFLRARWALGAAGFDDHLTALSGSRT